MKKKTDSEISAQVLREMRWDSRLEWDVISVRAHDGIVILEGEVTSDAKRSAAQNAAQRVAGVEDVVNEIRVSPRGTFARSDEDLARAVRHCLEWDALVPDERIKSTVINGWVRLEGNVGCWFEREDAERAIRRMTGVIGVTNLITVIPHRVDPRVLRTEIEQTLGRRADHEAERIRVEVVDADVNLYGRLHSWQEKRAVLGSIKNAPGVRRVRDYVHIDPYF